MKRVKFDGDNILQSCPFQGHNEGSQFGCHRYCPHFELIPAGEALLGECIGEPYDRIVITCSGMPVVLRVEK